MKTISYFLIFLFFSVYCQGQITNGDFENWKTLPTSPATENPVGWTSSNPIVTYQQGISAIEKSTDAYSGMYALKIKQIFDTSAYVKSNFITYNVYENDSNHIKSKNIGFEPNKGKFDTTNPKPSTISFYYKTVNIKYDPYSIMEVRALDSLDLSSHPRWVFKLTPSSIYKKISFRTDSVFGSDLWNSFHLYIQVAKSTDTAYKNGYVLIDNLTVESYLDIEENQLEPEISIFPNPAQDKFTISSTNTILKQGVLYDVQGKEVSRIKFNSTSQIIHVSELEKGIYFLQLQTKEGVITKEIVKK